MHAIANPEHHTIIANNFLKLNHKPYKCCDYSRERKRPACRISVLLSLGRKKCTGCIDHCKYAEIVTSMAQQNPSNAKY
jgi:hypothetical protein